MNTRNQIKILKEELKRRSALRKEQKTKGRKNESNFDKIVHLGVRYSWGTEEHKVAMAEYEKVKEEIPKPTIYREDLTAGYILYNRLRNRPSHLGDKEREDEYTWDVNRWIRWLEEKEKVHESEESGVEEEVTNAS